MRKAFSGSAATKWQAFQESRRSAPLIEDAIWTQDIAYIRGLPNDIAFTQEQSSRLLWLAIQTDDVLIFNAVLAKAADNNLNFRLTERVMPENNYAEHTLLYFALNYGRKNVAQRLAGDQKTDVELCGFAMRNGRRIDDPLPLDQAATNEDLQRVAGTLALRMAERMQHDLATPRRLPA